MASWRAALLASAVVAVEDFGFSIVRNDDCAGDCWDCYKNGSDCKSTCYADKTITDECYYCIDVNGGACYHERLCTRSDDDHPDPSEYYQCCSVCDKESILPFANTNSTLIRSQDVDGRAPRGLILSGAKDDDCVGDCWDCYKNGADNCKSKCYADKTITDECYYCIDVNGGACYHEKLCTRSDDDHPDPSEYYHCCSVCDKESILPFANTNSTLIHSQDVDGRAPRGLILSGAKDDDCVGDCWDCYKNGADNCKSTCYADKTITDECYYCIAVNGGACYHEKLCTHSDDDHPDPSAYYQCCSICDKESILPFANTNSTLIRSQDVAGRTPPRMA